MGIYELNDSFNIPFLEIAQGNEFALTFATTPEIKSNNIEMR
jgi:hypothetical protein